MSIFKIIAAGLALFHFKVKYWRPEWQTILYGSSDACLDKIMAAGFDGAFLDVIDAYYYFLAQAQKQE